MQSFKLKFLGVTILQGGRISHFPIDFWMGLTTVQRDCAACDSAAFCWQFPALNTAHKHCQVRLTGFLLLRFRFLEHSTSSSPFAISDSWLLPKTSETLSFWSVFCLVGIVATGAFVTIIVNYCVSEMAVHYYYYYYYYYYYLCPMV